jgi:hypothetical protein
MKRMLAAALAGAIAAEAIRHARQPRPPRPRPHPHAPQTWAEAREVMARQAQAAVTRRAVRLMERAGVPVPHPVPEPRGPRRGMFGPAAVTQILMKRRDQWDEDG